MAKWRVVYKPIYENDSRPYYAQYKRGIFWCTLKEWRGESSDTIYYKYAIHAANAVQTFLRNEQIGRRKKIIVDEGNL